ncbi:signal peptidase II [Williamsia sp. 1135]|uniref:signal peptidase II n=1 Tax=Williamsia sp. 1135 TaxID=1889262 RepID=UPI001F0B0759|nr:signal peptidase II [Williamsia sp. 1135]
MLSLALIIYGWRTAATAPTISTAGLALMAGGANANVIDRALDGRVTDYFHTGWWPTFNLADTFLTAGVMLVVVGTVWHERKSASTQTTSAETGQ